LVLGLDSVTNIAPGDIESYLPLHTVPPKMLLQVLVHFCASGMNRVRGIMGLLQDGLLQLLDARETQAAIIP
jgi:hypothetical protein